MKPEDCLKLADLIETDEDWYARDFSDVELAQALRAVATIERITAERDDLQAERDDLRKALEKLEFAIRGQVTVTREMPSLYFALNNALAALAVSDADRQ